MSKLIKCLKDMNSTSNLCEIALKIESNWLETLEIIGKINAIEENLICNSSGTGFFLNRKLDWVDENILNNNLSNLKLDNYLVKILPETVSTNSYVLNNIGSLHNNSVVFTEYQSHGRGRNDKSWTSKIGRDITVSFFYQLDINFAFELLPLITAVALNRVLKQHKIKNYIKWPNDIYLNEDEKIAGILLESGIRDSMRFVVIGVGIDNLFGINRTDLLTTVIFQMDRILKEYANFGIALIRREWLDNCIHYKKKVSLYNGDKLLDQGINIDLSSDGKIVIQSKNSTNTYFSSNLTLRFN